MLMGIPVSSYTAYQELDRNNYWDWAAKVTTLIGCIVVVRTRLGLIGVVLVMLALPAGVRLVNTVWMFAVEKPWLRPKIRLFDVKLLRSALREGVCIFVLQMAAVAIFQSDKIIVSSQLGAAQVTGFSILGVVFLQAYGLFALLLAPLWPAYGEAVRRGDIAWINRKLNISMAAGCAIMLTCGAIMFFAGDWVLSFLPGKVSVSKWLVVATTAMFVTRIFAECQSVVLNAASVLVPQMWILGANAALNIAIAILLARRIGVTGVVWSFPISAVLTSLWAYPWLIRRHITSRFQSP
jgi:O-antigen/teichoic acid export membrane protein